MIYLVTIEWKKRHTEWVNEREKTTEPKSSHKSVQAFGHNSEQNQCKIYAVCLSKQRICDNLLIWYNSRFTVDKIKLNESKCETKLNSTKKSWNKDEKKIILLSIYRTIRSFISILALSHGFTLLNVSRCFVRYVFFRVCANLIRFKFDCMVPGLINFADSILFSIHFVRFGLFESRDICK